MATNRAYARCYVSGAIAICLATYLAGIAFIAFLPPWEGYDEFAHYSYAQQIADTGLPPTAQEGTLSKDVETYQLRLPTPYKTTVPFDDNHGVTYRSWFTGGENLLSSTHEYPSEKRVFHPGSISNWQSQHPALYYDLMAPLVSVTSGLSWAAQLFILRAASWSLAFLGMVISILATTYVIKSENAPFAHDYTKIALAWPLLFPGIIPELARLGNDALVILLFSIAWALLVRRFLAPQRMYWYLSLGILLGLGGLTKITFLPITIASFGWLLWMEARRPRWRQRIRGWFGAFLVIFIYFAFTAKGYLANYVERGSWSGLVELSGEQVLGPFLWLGALQHPFEVAKGLLGMGMTFVWGGTASSAYPPAWFVLPFVFLAVVLAAFSVSMLRNEWRDLVVLAWFITLSVIGGLVYYLLTRIAVTGVGAGAPGWYLHTLIAPLSLLLSSGWNSIGMRFSFSQKLFKAWLVYMALFGIAVSWLQATLFTGCSFKTANSRMYSFDDFSCIIDLPVLYQRLDFLAYPTLGLSLSGIAIALIGWAVCCLRCNQPVNIQDDI